MLIATNTDIFTNITTGLVDAYDTLLHHLASSINLG